MFADSLVCPLCGRLEKLARSCYVCGRGQGMESGKAPSRECSVFGRSQGREREGQHPKGRYCVLGKIRVQAWGGH